MDKVEILILKNLLNNEEYARKVLPFLRKEYFEVTSEQIVYEEISKFISEYNKLATKEILCIEIENRKDVTDSSFKDVVGLVQSLEDSPSEFEWL